MTRRPSLFVAAVLTLMGLVGLIGLVGWLGCQRKEPTRPTIRPAKVVGDSMAPHFMGEHWEMQCDDCEYRFCFSIDPTKNLKRTIVCPNCGFDHLRLKEAIHKEADRVEVRTERQWKRWSVVAFQRLDQQGHATFGIKRVVGLPGETIQFQQGHLVCNGALLKKPFAVQKQTRIPVHDSGFVPKTAKKLRWRPSSPVTRWHRDGKTWVWKASNAQSQESVEPDWLVYHHWRCFLHRAGRETDFPIEDSYGFNPLLARDLNPTDDLFLEMDAVIGKKGQLEWRFLRDEIEYLFALDMADRILRVNARPAPQPEERSNTEPVSPSTHAAENPIPLEQPHRAVDKSWVGIKNVPLEHVLPGKRTIEFSTFDNQAIVAIDGRIVFEYPLPKRTGRVSLYPIAIGGGRGSGESGDGVSGRRSEGGRGGGGGDIRVNRIQLWRDIYYLPGPRAGKIASDRGVLMLGDNVPVSIDSRHWHPASIPSPSVIGVIDSR